MEHLVLIAVFAIFVISIPLTSKLNHWLEKREIQKLSDDEINHELAQSDMADRWTIHGYYNMKDEARDRGLNV